MSRWHAPLDPSCPKVKKYFRDLIQDPMTRAMGAPVDEIMEAFEHKHRKECKRCQKYGAENIEITD